jgi:hypothetical protein
MRCFADSENKKVSRSLLYVLQDLFMCIADRDESPRIAKLFRILRHHSIESTIEALSYLAQSVWMIDGTAFDHVEYIDFRPQRLRQSGAFQILLPAAGLGPVPTLRLSALVSWSSDDRVEQSMPAHPRQTLPSSDRDGMPELRSNRHRSGAWYACSTSFVVPPIT